MEATKNILSVFTYNSPVGKFLIFFNHNIQKWDLVLDDELLGHYTNTVAAADDVYCQATGSYEWDSYDIYSMIEEIPTDVYEWEHHIKK